MKRVTASRQEGFDPEFPATDPGDVCRLRMPGWRPPRWQASTFPEGFRDKITVIHDGIDTNRLIPNPGAGLTLNNSIPVTRQDQVITFVNRNLEPYRGCHIFMRALPELLMQLSTVHVYLTYPFVLSWSLLEAMSMGSGSGPMPGNLP